LVARGVVEDGADDAAVRPRRVRLDAPVDAAGQADQVERVYVDAGAHDRRRRRLVVRLVGDAGRLIAGVVDLLDHPRAEGVRLAEQVVTVRVGRVGRGALVLQRVVPGAQGDREVRDARLPGILLAVAVLVVEDGAL